MKFIIYILLMTGSIALAGQVMAQDKGSEKISWSVPANIPPAPGTDKQLGLAGVFTGTSNGVLIIAGGSNFADGAMPWQGGKKLHYDNVYVLEKAANGNFNWLEPKTNHLPQKIAYGASTTIPGGVICAGGETETSAGSTDVFLMSWDPEKKDVVITDLPSLPLPLANACITSIGKVIYLFGGESEGKPSAKCFTLNLADQQPQWKAITDLPVAMSHSVAVTQSNGKYPCIYVIGGRGSTLSGISDLHGYTFCYDPLDNQWTGLSNIFDSESSINISAATAVATGSRNIVLIGGDKGTIFHQIETYNALIARAKTDEEKQSLQQQKLTLLNNHPGFSRAVYRFNTLSNLWETIGHLPFYGQVTTTAVLWDGEIFIPGGEIKPGTRTSAVSMGKFNSR